MKEQMLEETHKKAIQKWFERLLFAAFIGAMLFCLYNGILYHMRLGS